MSVEKALNHHLYPATMGKYLQEKLVRERYYLHHMSSKLAPEAIPTLQFWDNGRTLPGRGQITHNQCGEDLGYYVCDCGHTEKWKRNCSKSQCPECFNNWIQRRTNESGNRLEQAAIMLRRVPRHVVLSPPPGAAPTTKELYRIIKLLGVEGGLWIEHPWRFAEQDTDEQIQWKRCDINPRSVEKVPSYVYRSLHFHLLCFGYLMSADKFYRLSGGWVYKNKGKRQPKRGQSHKQNRVGPIYNTIAYLISHTIIEGNRQTIRWFGTCANNKLEVAIQEEYLAKTCERCGNPMKKIRVIDGVHKEVDPLRKVRFKYYRFRS